VIVTESGSVANVQGEESNSVYRNTRNCAQVQSDESKPKRGKRRGAGRKPNLAKALLKGVSPTTILAAVENVDVGSIITGLLHSKREQTRLEALHFETR
jgi:hypothetical protein